jgi:hypothetical protein
VEAGADATALGMLRESLESARKGAGRAWKRLAPGNVASSGISARRLDMRARLVALAELYPQQIGQIVEAGVKVGGRASVLRDILSNARAGHLRDPYFLEAVEYWKADIPGYLAEGLDLIGILTIPN